jgi:hypothetical protein
VEFIVVLVHHLTNHAWAVLLLIKIKKEKVSGDVKSEIAVITKK